MENNQGAMCIAKNLVAHARTKQIDIHFHYIRSSEWRHNHFQQQTAINEAFLAARRCNKSKIFKELHVYIYRNTGSGSCISALFQLGWNSIRGCLWRQVSQQLSYGVSSGTSHRPTKQHCEKWILRWAFVDSLTLPHSVLWQKMDAFGSLFSLDTIINIRKEICLHKFNSSLRIPEWVCNK